MKKKIAIGVVVVCFLALLGAGVLAWPTLKVGSAFKAKNLCSAVFVSGRPEAEVLRDDLSFFPLSLIGGKTDPETGLTKASFFGLASATAYYRPTMGCTLLGDSTVAQLDAQAEGATLPATRTQLDAQRPYPYGEAKPELAFGDRVDQEAIEIALDDAFSEPNPEWERNTRAVLVIYKDRIIAERYAPGINVNTRLGGWSMTKSVTSALVGILVEQVKLDIHDPAPVPEWNSPGDPRGEITLDQLLRMSSGLKFGEVYEDFGSDVVTMLFTSPDTGAYAADQPPETEPDGKWYYSSGTTNIISRIVRQSVGGSLVDYHRFVRKELFDKLGMTSAIMEPDAAGTFVGSSFMYATARDWGRFGLLYLHDGEWNGERILPEGWVRYSTTPTEKAPKGTYGAQWWLNAGDSDNIENRPMPKLPPDTYSASGYEGQRVMIIPSRDLVIVRLGQSRPEKAFVMDDLVVGILDAIE